MMIDFEGDRGCGILASDSLYSMVLTSWSVPFRRAGSCHGILIPAHAIRRVLKIVEALLGKGVSISADITCNGRGALLFSFVPGDYADAGERGLQRGKVCCRCLMTTTLYYVNSIGPLIESSSLLCSFTFGTGNK